MTTSMLTDAVASTRRARLLYNFNLIDGSGQPAISQSAMLLEGDRIAQVWPGYTPGPEDLARWETAGPLDKLNLGGQTVMPGLVDMHVHLRRDEWALPLFLANGVTAVRDCANNLQVLQQLEQAVETGRLDGPRLFYSGPLFDGADLTWPIFMSRRVESAGQVKTSLAGLDAQPVDFIKLYTGLEAQAGCCLIEQVHALGYKVTAHLGQGQPGLLAGGLDGVEHIFSFSRLLAPERCALKGRHDDNGGFFLEVARLWYELGSGQLSDAELWRIFDLMLRQGTYLTPTLAFNYALSHRNLPELREDPQLEAVHPGLQKFWAKRSLSEGWQSADFALARESLAVMADYAVRFWRASGTLLLGSDTPNAFMIPGRSLHFELETLVAAGMPPLEAIHLATQGAARQLESSHRANRARKFGTLAAGYLADFLILDGDPVQDIRACRNIRYVARGGKFYDPATLLAAGQKREEAMGVSGAVGFN